MEPLQLLLFEEPLEGKLLREVKDLKESLAKVRKKLFAQNGELQKKYDDLRYEFEVLKAAMCQAALHHPKIEQFESQLEALAWE